MSKEEPCSVRYVCDGLGVRVAWQYIDAIRTVIHEVFNLLSLMGKCDR